MKREIPSDVLEQARKLCALSDNPTASIFEIEEALKLAHDLLAPYGLSIEDVLEGLHARDIVREEYIVPRRQRRVNWLNDLMVNVAWFTDTDCLFQTYYRLCYSFVGLLSEVQRAIFHAETLHEQIEYYGECRAPRNMRDIRVYKQGIVDRIHQTMQDLKVNRYKSDTTGPVLAQTKMMQIVNRILANPVGTRIVLLAPVTHDLNELLRRGFTRVKIDGEIREIKDLPPVVGAKIEVVVDRMVMREGQAARVEDSLQAAFAVSSGSVFGVVHAENYDTQQRVTFRAKTATKPLTPPPSLPANVVQQKRHLIDAYIDSHARHVDDWLQPTASAHSYNPDYNIGFQHGAEIQIRDGIGRRWRTTETIDS